VPKYCPDAGLRQCRTAHLRNDYCALPPLGVNHVPQRLEDLLFALEEQFWCFPTRPACWLYGSQTPPFKYFRRVIDIITSDVPEGPYIRAVPDSGEPPRK
jgi:hypothetical protein